MRRIRFITSGNPSTLPTFESTLFPPFQTILSSPNAPEFHPFIFQLLSQTLELHPTLPSSYAALLPPLLTPTLWESRGNIPALVRLLRATLERGAESIVAAGQTQAFLGVFQFLIGSRANDTFGFELLEALFQFLPLSVPSTATFLDATDEMGCRSELSKYASNPIFVLLLTRLQTSKTDKFSIGLVRFICFAGSIVRPGLDVESVVAMLDGCQAQPGYGPFFLSLESILTTSVDYSLKSYRYCCPRYRKRRQRIARSSLSGSATSSLKVLRCCKNHPYGPGTSLSSLPPTSQY